MFWQLAQPSIVQIVVAMLEWLDSKNTNARVGPAWISWGRQLCKSNVIFSIACGTFGFEFLMVMICLDKDVVTLQPSLSGEAFLSWTCCRHRKCMTLWQLVCKNFTAPSFCPLKRIIFFISFIRLSSRTLRSIQKFRSHITCHILQYYCWRLWSQVLGICVWAPGLRMQILHLHLWFCSWANIRQAVVTVIFDISLSLHRLVALEFFLHDLSTTSSHLFAILREDYIHPSPAPTWFSWNENWSWTHDWSLCVRTTWRVRFYVFLACLCVCRSMLELSASNSLCVHPYFTTSSMNIGPGSLFEWLVWFLHGQAWQDWYFVILDDIWWYLCRSCTTKRWTQLEQMQCCSVCAAHTNGPLPGTCFEMAARTPGNALVVDHELPFTQCRAHLQSFTLSYIHLNSL